MHIRKIGFAADQSDASMKAATYAVDFAKQRGATIFCIYIIPRPSELSIVRNEAVDEYYQETKDRAKKSLQKIVEIANKQNVTIILDLQEGDSIVDRIISYATKKNVDLIVLGTRGTTRSRSVLVGSVAMGVMANAHCPVLVVR